MDRMEGKAKEKKIKEEYEKCVCCHAQLNVPLKMMIDVRSFYIEGAGQLCYDCYHKLYK